MEAVQRRRGYIAQPVEDQEPVVPQPSVSTKLTVPLEEETDIRLRKDVHSRPLSHRRPAEQAEDVAVSSPSSSFSSDGGGMVVDMQQKLCLQNCVKVRQPGLSENELSINVRLDSSACRETDELADLQVLQEVDEPSEKLKGCVTIGGDAEICALLDETPTSQRGVICQEQKVLVPDNGEYAEGRQYKVIPGTESQGASGKATKCQDLSTGKVFIRKTVTGKVSRNEIEVPLKFRRSAGVPEVYAVSKDRAKTEIFQEFAGLSLKKLMDTPAYQEKLCDPKMVMVLAFQAFATLDKLHSQNIIHQDIKPENLCIDNQEGATLGLKFIDFGSSQTPKDPVTFDGLTNEYLSPESCRAILQVAAKMLPREQGRLGPGTDVWALALSLLYCLCGYHVMVYVCTGMTRYAETGAAELQQKRVQSLVQICNLTDEDIQKKLIHPEWPEALKVLLTNTLHVDPQQRWSAKQAAHFILTQWILRGTGAMQQQPQTSPPPQTSGFSGLTPARLVIRSQAVSQPSAAQVAERDREVQAAQVASPASAAPPQSSSVVPVSRSDGCPSQPLPAFTDLLSDGLSKKAPRPYHFKQRKVPYPLPPRRGSKKY